MSRQCSNCAGVLDADSRFCKHCGLDLGKQSQYVSQPAAKRSISYVVLAGGVAMIALIAILSLWKWNSAGSGIASSYPTSTSSSSQSASTPTPSRFELTREAVLDLVKGRMTKDVDAAMPSMALYPDTQRWQVYKQMVDTKIIICPSRGYFGDFADCKPGPNGKQLRMQNGTLTIQIGHKIPSVIGVSRLDQTSALAQVSLTFESSGGYEFFKRYQPAFKANPLFGSGYDMDNEQHSIHLRLYDDGWRIERIE